MVEEKPDPQIFYNEIKELLYVPETRTEFTVVPLYYNLQQFLRECCSYVCGPIYPDPDLLPVPEPEFK